MLTEVNRLTFAQVLMKDWSTFLSVLVIVAILGADPAPSKVTERLPLSSVRNWVGQKIQNVKVTKKQFVLCHILLTTNIT